MILLKFYLVIHEHTLIKKYYIHDFCALWFKIFLSRVPISFVVFHNGSEDSL